MLHERYGVNRSTVSRRATLVPRHDPREPRQALADMRTPVHPIVLARPLAVFVCNPERCYRSVKVTILVQERVVQTDVDMKARYPVAAAIRRATQQRCRVTRTPSDRIAAERWTHREPEARPLRPNLL